MLRHLADELATWRRRCLKAEGELSGLKATDGMVPGDDVVRMRAHLLDLERRTWTSALALIVLAKPCSGCSSAWPSSKVNSSPR